MKNVKKKLLSVCLALVLVLSLAPVQVLAEDGGADGEITAITQPEAVSVQVGTVQEDLPLPDELAATVMLTEEGGAQEQPATLPVVQWDCPDYDPDTPGEYIFIPTPGELPYPLAAGLTLPALAVVVQAAEDGEETRGEGDGATALDQLAELPQDGAPSEPLFLPGAVYLLNEGFNQNAPALQTGYSVPVYEDFPAGWLTLSDNSHAGANPAYQWGFGPTDWALFGNSSMISHSYCNNAREMTADNWLISSSFTIPTGTAGDVTLSWYDAALDSSSLDNYAVYIGLATDISIEAYRDGTGSSDVLQLWTGQPTTGLNSPTQRTVTIPDSYKGKEVRIAFGHQDYDQYILILDNVQVYYYAAPDITTASLPNGTVGQAYSQQLEATGNATIWSLASGNLPDGLTLSQAGLLSGTPTANGIFTFTVKAANGVNPDATQQYTVTIAAAPKAPDIITESLLGGQVELAYSQQLAATGASPFIWTIAGGTLPSGLTLSTDGLISGTPTSSGTFTFTVKVESGVAADAVGGTKEFSIAIAAGEVSIPTPPGYTYQLLQHPPTGVSLTGWFTPGISLEVTQNHLHDKGTCNACDEIRAAGTPIALYDVSLYEVSTTEGCYNGAIELTLPVPESYNGQQVLVRHCKQGQLEEMSLVVSNGYVKGTFSSLSPFAIFATNANSGGGTNTSPQTGDTNNIGLWITLLGISVFALAGCGIVLRRRKKALKNR